MAYVSERKRTAKKSSELDEHHDFASIRITHAEEPNFVSPYSSIFDSARSRSRNIVCS